MTLITLEELARGLSIALGGGLAGTLTVSMPGSPLWLIPAAGAVAGCALTVPEIRSELAKALPLLAEARHLLPAPRHARRGAQTALGADAAHDRADLTAATNKRHAHPSNPSQRSPQQVLAEPEWLTAVNDRPDDNPHLTVVGPSGSGKTTFVSAALGKRPGRVVVLTPKVSPGAWRGAEVVTLDDDLSYETLAASLEELKLEARTRARALAQGQPLEPLTVVLDELPELHAEIPGAGKFAVRLSRWGRELCMRQVVIATSDDALNIPGWAATRSNYVRVELSRPTPDGTRPASLDDGQTRHALDVSHIRASAETSRLRPWRESHLSGDQPPATEATASHVAAPFPQQISPTDLLAELLAEDVAAARAAVPSISPERTERLARIMAQNPVSPHQNADIRPDEPRSITSAPTGNTNRITVDTSPGGSVLNVNVTQVTGGPRRPQRGKGLDVRARRKRISRYTRVRAMVGQGARFEDIYRAVKGNRNEVHAEFKRAKAELGIAEIAR